MAQGRFYFLGQLQQGLTPLQVTSYPSRQLADESGKGELEVWAWSRKAVVLGPGLDSVLVWCGCEAAYGCVRGCVDMWMCVVSWTYEDCPSRACVMVVLLVV
jgi:hypothetical protein